MKVFIHLPQDMRKGHREIEIHKHGQVMVLTEEEMDKAYQDLQNAPLDKEQEKEDRNNFGQVPQSKQTDPTWQAMSDMRDSFMESLRPDYDRV